MKTASRTRKGLMLDGELEIVDYKGIKRNIEETINKSQREKVNLESIDTDYMSISIWDHAIEKHRQILRNRRPASETKACGFDFPRKLIFEK